MKNKKVSRFVLGEPAKRFNANTTTEYYTGKTYRLQGCVYPVTTTNKYSDEVKRYTSKKRAENACESLNLKSWRLFKVYELEEIECQKQNKRNWPNGS